MFISYIIAKCTAKREKTELRTSRGMRYYSYGVVILKWVLCKHLLLGAGVDCVLCVIAMPIALSDVCSILLNFDGNIAILRLITVHTGSRADPEIFLGGGGGGQLIHFCME